MGINATGITVGNTGSTGSIALQGTASATITLGTTTQTGTITVGQSTASNTINIGNGTIATGNTGTINIGTSATGTGKTAITIGSINGASSLTLQGGTGGIALTGNTTLTGTLQVTSNLVANVGLYTGAGAGTLRISSTGALSSVSIPTASNVTVGSNNAYGILYVNTSNVLQFANINGTYSSTTKCLMSDGTTGLGFGTCPGGGGSGWSLTGNNTAGSVLGSNTASSADFVISSRPNNVAATSSSASYISFGGAQFSVPNVITISANANSNSAQGGGAHDSSKDYFRVQNSDGTIAMAVQGSSTPQVFMYLASGGGVGVNSRVCSQLSPNTAGLTTLATCTTSGTDLAEAYNSTQALEPGDIVATDPDNYPNTVRSSVAAQDNLMGIVSTDPDYIMGEGKTPDGYPIALNGRVPTKVNGEGGPIHAGDKITSSSVPGVGKKATGPGMVVGTALTDFDGTGQGTIEVFVHVFYYVPSATDTLQAQTATLGNLNVSGTATINNLTVTGLAVVHDLEISGHIITSSGQPTSEVTTEAGIGATVTINGNDTTGTIIITTGDSPLAGSLAHIIFSDQYTAIPHVVLSPSNGNAADLSYYKGTTTTTGFDFNANSVPLPNTTYEFDYFISQ